MNKFIQLSIVIGFFLASSASAQDGPNINGYVKAFAFEQAVDPWQLERAGTRMQLALSGGEDNPASYYAALDFELNSELINSDLAKISTGDQRDGGFKVYPVEIYANLSFGPCELRLGQQYIFWGRTSWVNPTDVVSAWDYANIASEIEDYRVAPIAARFNWYASDDLKLDLVWVPVFQPHRIPIEVPTSMGGLPVANQGALMPDKSLVNTELGLRISHSISSLALDWSLAAYLGHDKSPSISISPEFESRVMGPPGTPPVMIPTQMNWQTRYQRMLMIGADFAKAIGPVVITGEAALKSHPLLVEGDEDDLGSRAEYVIGADYAFNQDLQFGLQYVGSHRLNYDADEQRALLQQRMGREPDFVNKATDHQTTLRIQAKLMENIGMQLIALYDWTYQDFMALALLDWSVADALKVYLGTIAFGGMDAHTPFARQADFSRVFVELKYSF